MIQAEIIFILLPPEIMHFQACFKKKKKKDEKVE